jgi:lysophospholipase L1-like esterase
MSRATRARRIVAAGLYGGGSLGALSAALYGVLYGESKLARRRIKEPTGLPPESNGTWGPDGLADSAAAVVRAGRRSAPAATPLVLAMIGDSSAAGFGAGAPEHTPGAVIAVRLSGLTGRPVQLLSTAVIGARSSDLASQIGRALAGQHPDIALIMIGANDVTHRVKASESIRYLTAAVQTLGGAGVPVVVATCPDLGTIKPIAQPLRFFARRLSRSLAAAQTIAVVEAGGRTVSLGDLLGPEFAKRRELFSEDQFHPSEHGYRAAAEAILPSIMAILDLPTETSPAGRFTGRRARPIASAAARAAGHPGTEVAQAQVDGESFGERGRWARLLRRNTEPTGLIEPGLGDHEDEQDLPADDASLDAVSQEDAVSFGSYSPAGEGSPGTATQG